MLQGEGLAHPRVAPYRLPDGSAVTPPDGSEPSVPPVKLYSVASVQAACPVPGVSRNTTPAPFAPPAAVP